MPHEILESMRALREEMRQRLLQVPEYRALVSLDRSIDELCDILQGKIAQDRMTQDHRMVQDHRMTQDRMAPERVEYQPVPPPAPMPMPVLTTAPVSAAAPQPADVAPPRSGAIASAFAETLAAKIDQRNLARASAVYSPPTHRSLGG